MSRMNRNHKTLCRTLGLALCAAAYCSFAVAAESKAPQLRANPTLSDYIRYALRNNPGLDAEHHRVLAARERVTQARTLPDPRLSYKYFIERVETRTGPQRQAFGLSQTIPWPGTLLAAGDARTAEARAAQEIHQVKSLALVAKVRRTYYEYAYLARARDVVEDMMKLLATVEEIARARYKVSEANHPNLIRLQVEYARLEDRLKTLNIMRSPIVARLNAALNRPVAAHLPWPAQLPDAELRATAEEILAIIHRDNPELKALDQRIKSANHTLTQATRAPIPSVTLGVEWIQTGSARGSGVSNSGNDPIAAMVSVTIPIWWGKYKAAQREARARLRTTALRKDNRTNLIAAESRMILFRLRDAERKVSFYRDTLIPKAEQALTVTERAFSVGKATFADFVDAERTLLELRLSYELARTQAATEIAEIDAMLGRIPELDAPRKPLATTPMKGRVSR
jgi:outer membrane protein, heavy metal efflux system